MPAGESARGCLSREDFVEQAATALARIRMAEGDSSARWQWCEPGGYIWGLDVKTSMKCGGYTADPVESEEWGVGECDDEEGIVVSSEGVDEGYLLADVHVLYR